MTEGMAEYEEYPPRKARQPQQRRRTNPRPAAAAATNSGAGDPGARPKPPNAAKRRVTADGIARVNAEALQLQLKRKKQSSTWYRPLGSSMGPVKCAAFIVADELRQGNWPSKYMQADIADSAERQAELRKLHQEHSEHAASSLEHFALNVVFPQLQTCHAIPPTWSINQPPRAFYATLLALREVMAQNAVKLFGHDFLPHEPRRGATDASLMMMRDAFGKPKRKKQKKTKAAAVVAGAVAGTNQPASANVDGNATDPLDAYEDKQVGHFLALSFATSIIITAVESNLQASSAKTIDQFLTLAKEYDEGNDEFANCLEKRDGRFCGVLPNGSRLNPEENIAATISYNRSLEQHHLTQLKRARALKLPPANLVDLPTPDACHMVLLEKTDFVSGSPTARLIKLRDQEYLNEIKS